MNVLVYCAVAALLFYILRVTRRKSSFDTRGLKALPEPPGALPYVGHALQMGASMHLKLHEWKQKYGDLFMVRMGQMNMIILSSDKVVQDLIVRRGALYSGRMRSVTHHNIATRGYSLFLSPYNAYYKSARAISNKVLSPQKIRSYSPKLMQAARQLVRVLLDDPENRAGSTNPREYFRLFPTSIMMDVLGNVHVTGVDDKKFLQYMKFLDDFVDFVAVENSLVEFFPVLNYMPFLNIKKQAIHIRDSAESLLTPVLEDVRNDPEKRPCVMRDCLEDGCEDLPTIHLLNNILIGASETVPGSMYWVTAILAKHPSVQSRIHEELDRVVGRDRLPTFDDESNLPYLRATIREAQRFRTIVPFGVPHCIEQDDVYEGYHIPKDSLVLINAWSLNLDEQRFKDPERFDPERYLDVSQTSAALLHGPCEKRDHYAFGGGRRFCVGVHLAEAELFVFTAHLLWAFRIDLPSDDPNAVDIDNPKQGTTLWPEAYRVHFVPRHENISELCPMNA